MFATHRLNMVELPTRRRTTPKAAALWLRSVAVLGAMACAATTFAADIVNLRDGTRVAGEITASTKDDLTIKPSVGDARTVAASDVVSVEWNNATAELKLGINDENGGRFEQAVNRVTKSKADATNADDRLKLEYDFILARIAAREALVDKAKLDAAITKLDNFRKASSSHFRHYDAVNRLGQLQMAKGDFNAAQTTYALLEQAKSNEYKLTAKVAQGRIELAQGQNDAAIRNFDAAMAAAGNSPSEQLRKYDAMLGKAKAQAMTGQHAEALAALEEVVNKAPADATDLQAEAYVLQGNSLQALNRPKEAVLSYLHVDILFPRESSMHAEALYHMARLWKVVQAPERGISAEAKLTSSYPDSEWAQKLATGG